ncbi:MAG: hypothetical protein IKY10_04105, partial [Clostridia bacterium]|nr:hypothetical protein [Clostridia bacterium]
ETKKETFINNLDEFREYVNDYSNLNETKLSKTAFNKYNLSVVSEDLQELNDFKHENDEATIQIGEELINEETTSNETEQNSETENANENTETSNETIKENLEVDDIKQEKISTLYSLSNDIETSCDDFCELKEEITNAIIETQNLIEKVSSKEIELTKEQRMFINEQSSQLKNLGRQLSNITTELSFHLSDLNQIMTTNDGNIDTLNLKYLVVLDNLINGNEMLQTSLSNLNLINQMFNLTSPVPSNNQGRILYGFQHNNNPPVVKDYYIDEQGELIDNSNNENKEEKTENAIEVENNKSNIDTYQNKALTTNIDTYQNSNLPRNIDSFFNTALLDNEFMYGNGGYGYGGYNNFYGMQNPYMNNYTNYERNNTTNGNTLDRNTQNNETNPSENKSNKEKKRIKLKKNIDTYKDENEPDIKTKLGNIKNSISGFFKNFNKLDLKLDLNDKIENPVYRYNSNKTK